MVQAEERVYARVQTLGNVSCWEMLELRVCGKKRLTPTGLGKPGTCTQA